MQFTLTNAAFIVIALALSVLFAAGGAVAAGALHRMAGATVPAAVSRAGAAFAAIFALIVSVLALLTSWLM